MCADDVSGTGQISEQIGGPIAYLTSEYPKVSHTFILREIEALRAQGIAVVTCSTRKPPASLFKGPREQAAHGSTFYIIDTARRRPDRLIGAHLGWLARRPGAWFRALGLAWKIRQPGVKAMFWHLFYFLEAGLLADHLRRRGVVQLHNHFSNPSCSVAMLAALIADIPFSFTAHGPEEFFHPYENALSEKVARARFVAAISHFCRSQLMLFSDPRHWDRIAIVHCGIDPRTYGRTPRDRFAKRVLFVGRLAPVKGGPLLLEAFARALKVHPDATLTIVGDGTERPALEARAARLNLGDAVTFAGYRTQEQVADHLEGSDMLVLPSFAEGVPVVLMEAMAARLPTIASRVAGVPELVRDGETGFVTPPGDLDTLADRLIRLMSDPDLCRRMGEAGRAVVEAEHLVDREAHWLARLFSDGPTGALRARDTRDAAPDDVPDDVPEAAPRPLRDLHAATPR